MSYKVHPHFAVQNLDKRNGVSIVNGDKGSRLSAGQNEFFLI